MARMRYKPLSEIKGKYHTKTLSDSALYLTWIRNLDMFDLFAEFLWLNISIFDLSQLGMVLLTDIVPIDFQPYAINFTYEMPDLEELLQGILIDFKKIDYSKIYDWMTDIDLYIDTNIKLEYREDLKVKRNRKARYGITRYDYSYYDPYVPREFLKATFHRLRLLRTPDTTYYNTIRSTSEQIALNTALADSIYNRLFAQYSAQANAFILGMAVLGRSRLSEVRDGYTTIPIVDAKGNLYDLKFRTLDHLQMGFILGITPLGYGVLLPSESIYRQEENKYDPPIIKVMMEKIRDIRNRITISTYAYSNYNKPEEMIDRHKSDRTAQYHIIQGIRRQVESWVEAQIPPEESNPVRIRQYQSACLQMISWRAKRHRWGFETWKFMTEEEFKTWWINNWSSQGLNKDTLNKLFEGMRIWLESVREQKLKLGEKVKRARYRLAGRYR